MSLSSTKIKLFGPGISNALKELHQLDTVKEFETRIYHSGIYIGEIADFEIVWREEPPTEEVLSLVKYLDKIFSESKCRYTITSTKPDLDDVFDQIETSTTKDIALTFIRLIGPSISRALDILNENIESIPGIKAVTGELLGRYDYAFEWLRIPDINDIVRLTETMDRVLNESGVIYSIATKSKLRKFTDIQVESKSQEFDPVSFVKGRSL